MIKLVPSKEDNRYSQGGEESIIKTAIQEIIRRKGGIGWLVEFGGSRGTDNSNLFRFGEEGFNLIMIEADKSRFIELESKVSELNSVKAICARVGFSANDNLGALLLEHNIQSSTVSVVSIDIDSDDAAVFESLGCRPDLAIVEFNPTFSADARYRNPPGSQIGNSIGELLHVAENRSMFPVALTGTNLIFMLEDYRDVFQEINIIEELKKFELIRFAWGYDGSIVRYATNGRDLSSEIMHNGWNNTLMIQPLPKILRKFGSPKLNFRLAYFFAVNFISSPFRITKLILDSARKSFRKK